MGNRLKSSLLACLLILSAGWNSVYAEPKPSIVFFGDSLSDTGNRYLDEGIVNTPPYDLALADDLVPSYPYAIGGPTFTNGTAWTKLFARALGAPGTAQAALRNEGTAANYAYAGARASNLPPLEPNANRNLTDQVQQYLADVNGGAFSDALHVVFIGGNDVAEAVGAYLLLFPQFPDQAPVVLQAIVQNAVMSTVSQVLQLQAAGAERFLLVLAPNSGYSPLFAAGRPFSQMVGYVAASGFNCAIAGVGPTRTCEPSAVPTLVEMLEGSGATVHVLDGQGLFDDIINNAGGYGLLNTTDHCIAPNEAPYRCMNPDEYVYWDNIHPTARVHEIIAAAAVSAVSD